MRCRASSAASTARCTRPPAARCRSTPRRSASARGLAATATATRTSRRRSRGEACLLSRWMAADLYLKEIEALRDELSMTRATPELRARVGDAREPYRELLRGVRQRLRATRDWIEASLQADRRAAAARRRLPRCRVAARAVAAVPRLARRHRQCATSAPGRLLDVLRRVAAFGVTLAPLDIRQESERHTGALDAITRALGLGSYAEWDEERRLEFLVRELDNPRPLIPPDLDATPEVRDVLDTFAGDRPHPSRVARRLRHHDDAAGVRRAGGGAAAEGGAASPRPLRVVPLFETAADLRNAGRGPRPAALRSSGIAAGSTAGRRSWSATPIRRRTSGA